MDGNTRFARTFRIQQYTIVALTRLAEIQTSRAIAAGKEGDAARCTLTDALELAVMRAAAAEERAERRPEPGELRAMADLLGDMADLLDDAPPADEARVAA